jgi:hypothetical protein
MVQIDEDMLRRRAEHNDRSLRNLEEISLHQQNIEGINRSLSRTHALWLSRYLWRGPNTYAYVAAPARVGGNRRGGGYTNSS